MAEYSERDLQEAAELRERIHREALEKVRAVFPDAEDVVDPHPAEDYLTEHWDYPGMWYTMVSIPQGFRSRDAFVNTIVRDTLERCRSRKEQTLQVRLATGEEMLALWGCPALSSAPPTARFFYRQIVTGGTLFWALAERGEIVGELYAFLALDDRDFADGKNTAYLCAFRVRKDRRGQGFGSRLMRTALRELKSRGFSGVTVGVGRTETRNRLMYHHFGFCRKIKDCFADPCSLDENMQPQADPGFWLLYKPL